MPDPLPKRVKRIIAKSIYNTSGSLTYWEKASQGVQMKYMGMADLAFERLYQQGFIRDPDSYGGQDEGVPDLDPNYAAIEEGVLQLLAMVAADPPNDEQFRKGIEFAVETLRGFVDLG
jgi:hypothetical protein